MFSVTGLIKNIKQPKGGYVPLNLINEIKLEDNHLLSEKENISPASIGIVVDYLTRLMIGDKNAFKNPEIGAMLCKNHIQFLSITNKIKGLDDESVINTCKLVKYDSFARTGNRQYLNDPERVPDQPTIENIIIMVKRALKLWEDYGPVVLSGFTFKGAKAMMITSADGDYMTKDTLWDFKVSKYTPTIEYTLQLLMYYLLGISSVHNEFGTIKKLAIFNPRKNTIYEINIEDIDQNNIAHVYSEVMMFDIREEFVISEIEEMKNCKLRRMASKAVKRSKQELDYNTYLYAVWDNGNLIEKVPVKYRDAKLCYTAFCELHYDIDDKDDNCGMVSDLNKYLKFVPDESKSQNFYDKLVMNYDSYNSRDLLILIPEIFRSVDILVDLAQDLSLDEIDEKYKTSEFYSKFALKYPKRYKEVPSEYHTREVFVRLATSGYSKKNIAQIPEQYLDEQFFVDIIKIDGEVLKVIPEKYISRKVCEIAINEKASLIRYVSQNIEGYNDLCTMAVTNDWKAIKYIPEQYRDEHLKEIASKQSKSSLKFFK